MRRKLMRKKETSLWKKKFPMRGVLECDMQQKETLTPRAGKKSWNLEILKGTFHLMKS